MITESLGRFWKFALLLASIALFGFGQSTLAQSVPLQTPSWLIEATTPVPQKRLIWQTTPGIRYDLWKSDNLLSWTHAPGFPTIAEGLSQELTFTPSERGFFRFYPIDEQPPFVVE